MSASKHSLTDEQVVLTIATLLGVSSVFWVLGFSSGWDRGRTELVLSLDRAQRIQWHLSKESI